MPTLRIDIHKREVDEIDDVLRFFIPVWVSVLIHRRINRLSSFLAFSRGSLTTFGQPGLTIHRRLSRLSRVLTLMDG